MTPVLVLVSLLFSRANSVCHDEAENALACVTNTLNFKFLKETQCVRPNMAFSPLGITISLCIMYAASTGKTAQEIEMILGLDHVGLKDVHRIIRDYLFRLSGDIKSYTLVLPTGLWIHKDHPINSNFEDFLDCYYNTTVVPVDFECNSSKVLKLMNNWVREKSCLKIPIASDIEPDTKSKLFIISLSCFWGYWYKEFKKENICPRVFYNEGDTAKCKKVKSMFVHGEFLYYSGPCYSAVKIPYESPYFAMVIFLPLKNDGIFSLEKALNPDNFVSTIRCMQKREIEIFLPMFTAEFSRDIAPVLINLGLLTIFTPDGFLSALTPSNDIFVTNFGHKALVEVKAEGGNLLQCEGNKSARYLSTKFNCDHPFAFYIIDPFSNIIFFSGRVTSL